VKAGDLYEGPKAIQTIDGVTAHWAETDDGPVRLVYLDGSYRVAGKDDAVQPSDPERLVELEVESIHGSASTEA